MDLDVLAQTEQQDTARQSQQAIDQIVTADPTGSTAVAVRTAAWSDIAPTLPAGVLQSLAQANLTPDSPVGQWLVRNGVPALLGQQSFTDPKQSTTAEQLSSLLSDPNLVTQLRAMPIGAQEQLLANTTPQKLAGVTPAKLSHVFQTGALPVHHSFWNKIGDIATTGIRDVGTGLQAGAEGVAAFGRAAVADTVHSGEAIAHGDFGYFRPSFGQVGSSIGEPGWRPEHFRFPNLNLKLGSLGGNFAQDVAQGHMSAPSIGIGHTDLTIGTSAQVHDYLSQITAAQALQGKDLGGGFFPGGEAHQAAVEAQVASAAINGHALTPGRALASTVFEPGSAPYQLASGALDAYVAIHGDPANLLLQEVGSGLKTARIFAPDSETALRRASQSIIDRVADGDLGKIRDWAGHPGELPEAVYQKLKADPAGLAQLIADGTVPAAPVLRDIGAPEIGAFKGLRRWVDGNQAMTFLAGDRGAKLVDHIANNPSFTDLRASLGKDVPVELVAQLAKEKDPTAIRTLLGDALGTDVRNVPNVGFDWTRKFDTKRWANFMPYGSVSHTNLNDAVEQGARLLAEAKVPADRWDAPLQAIAETTSRGQFYNNFVNKLGGVVADRLVEAHGISQPDANKIVRFFANNVAGDAKYYVDEVGNLPYVPGLVSGGEAIPLSGPTLGAELVDSIPVPDARDIRRAASLWAKVDKLNQSESALARGGAKAIKLGDVIAASSTNAFKAGKLFRLGLPARIIAEAQARMATAGLSSTFNDAMDYAAWAVGHKGASDVTGANFIDHLGDAASQYVRGVGASSWVNGRSVFDGGGALAKAWTTFGRSHPEYEAWWADELSTLHADPVSREVARAIRDPQYVSSGIAQDAGVGRDAVKEWFANGPGDVYRQHLIDANLKTMDGTPWSVHLGDRNVADAYIDNVVAPRVMTKTANGHPDLLEAVTDGTPFGPQGINTDLIGNLAEMKKAGVGPLQVKGLGASTAGKPRVLAQALDRFFSSLVETPYRVLAKEPAFKQFYWKEGTRLLPYSNEATQAKLVENAAKAGIDLTVPTRSGELSLDEVHKLSMTRALKDSQDMLHYVAERNNMADTLRYIAPFGDAWRNVLTQWSKLALANPNVVRRVQQGVTEARQSGFFHTDPQTGKEVFTFMPGAATKALTGVDWPLTSEVKGLNLAAQGLPGIGPVAMLAADKILPHHGTGEAIRNYLAPYGVTDFSTGTAETFFPGWAARLRTSGWFKGWPGLSPGGTDRVTLQHLADDVFSYHVAAGHLKFDGPDGPAKLESLARQSLKDAQHLYLLRGLASTVAPAAVDYTKRAKLKDGQWVELAKVSSDYQAGLKANGGDEYKTTLDMVDKYGPEVVFATEPKTRNTFGIPTTADGIVFAHAHPGLLDRYPDVAKYWVPRTGSFDYRAYTQAIQDGKIESPSTADWARLADARLGNAMYANKRSLLGASPAANQREWLGQVRAAIAAQYPGFDSDATKASRNTLDQNVNELRYAVRDKGLSGTPLSHAAIVYMELRDRALAEARARTGNSTTTLAGSQMSDLRDWLYQNGTAIATQMPEFTYMWESLFSNEVAPAEPGVTP